ncbi:MAG TPA: hypothetical protein ENJ79_03270 [Gammaproteobacteria bacterium]|nr:hypothetical protein [Gammaproteobacteria bacterium]
MELNDLARLRRIADRVDALQLRERLLLLAAGTALLFFGTDLLLLQPILKRQQHARAEIGQLESQLAAGREQARLLRYRSEEDPLLVRREQYNRMQQELAALDRRIRDQLGVLVEPAQAADLLKQVLQRQPGLSLRALKATAEPLREDPAHTVEALADRDPEIPAGIGRYHLSLVVEGSYPKLLAYLGALEALPWKFFWEQIDFRSESWPRAVTRIELYTLGTIHG